MDAPDQTEPEPEEPAPAVELEPPPPPPAKPKKAKAKAKKAKAARSTEQQRPRIAIANRADGGIPYWIGKLSAFAALLIVAGVALSSLATYRYFVLTTPAATDFRHYAKRAPGVTRIYAADNTLLGEFAKETREIVPYDQIPQQLIDAVVAVEDHDFFEHGGIYWKGILRAAWTNLKSNDFEQGGSTITQQVAKQSLTADKSLSRKAREAILARRLEATYSKKAILSYYLNQIYLGAGAYGVAAAAHKYFQKDLKDLTLAEAALIAGLPKAPSTFSPIAHPKEAKARRDLVLDQMVRYRHLDKQKAEAAKAEPIRLNVAKEVFPSRMPYFAEHLRRYVVEKYGLDALMTGGLRVEGTVEPTFDAGAYDSIDYGTRHQDKRQGWRGPEWYVDGPARDMVIARQKQVYGAGPLQPGKRYLAVVDRASCDGADVIIGDRKLELPLHNMRWAAPWSATNAENDREIGCASRAIKPGDVIWVSREIRTRDRYREFFLPDNINPSWRPHEDQHEWDAAHPDVVQLEQVPHPQGAIFTGDHHTGYVVAMVGGYDYARSELNRALQSCRQPGSSYKPIYYSAALDEGYGFDSMFYDKPIEMEDADTGDTFTPTNLNGTIDSDVTLEYALVFSKNIPSVEIFGEVGAKNLKAWTQRLGFTTPMVPDECLQHSCPALALGASCSYLDDLSRAFAIFARNGKWLDWSFVRRVLDRDGNALEDHTVYFDPMLSAGDRLDRLAATAGVRPAQAIPARTAFLTSKLLAQMVNYGFTSMIRTTEIHAAGKTGTSSKTMDNSFVAYTSRYLTAVWMGDDRRERELGHKDAAYMTVVPVWARYMYDVARDFPNPELPAEVPEGVNPKDRGDHAHGRHGGPMTLIYRHAEKPDEDEGDGGDGGDGTPPVDGTQPTPPPA